MKKKMETERKWDASKPEIRFEQLLQENGFRVTGITEYVSKTNYLIEKDGIDLEWSVYSVDNRISRGNEQFKVFLKSYNIKKELERLRAMM